ncbi:MAG: hypothetical protein CM1200mP25_1530 [Acidobacteriota bacterium]|nr:MAG: hypothetical protein CM1200mP25_1530 [Acidobacteriota bacterium]
MREVAASLTYINVGHRDEFYHTLRTLLVHRVQDLALFDDAFRVFWRPPHGDWTETDLRAMGETRGSGNPEYESERAASRRRTVTSSRTFQVERMATLSYSQREGLWAKDFEISQRKKLRLHNK